MKGLKRELKRKKYLKTQERERAQGRKLKRGNSVERAQERELKRENSSERAQERDLKRGSLREKAQERELKLVSSGEKAQKRENFYSCKNASRQVLMFVIPQFEILPFPRLPIVAWSLLKACMLFQKLTQSKSLLARPCMQFRLVPCQSVWAAHKNSTCSSCSPRECGLVSHRWARAGFLTTGSYGAEAGQKRLRLDRRGTSRG